MRFERVLLIKPFYSRSHYNSIHLAAGLGYISEALDRAGILNTVIDMGLGYDFESLKKQIRAFKPDLIGLSLMTFGYRDTYKFIADIKKAFPEVAIAVGGPHMSTLRTKVLEECPSIDYGITLEGEETFVALCRDAVSISQVKGLLFRQSSGEIAYTGDREFVKNLDALGFPRYAQFEREKYPRRIVMVTSRGCPSQCIYCPVHQTIGNKFRVRSPGSVADEFEYWYRKGYLEFEIADDNFTLQRERVSKICAELKKRNLSGLRIACGNGIRADRVDRDLLVQMKEVGFYYLGFGVEAGNNKILKRLKKGENIEVIERAIKDACDLGYMVTLFFLLGSPGENENDVKDSLRLALKYPVYDVRFYNLIPFPGTELYGWVRENRYFVKGENDYEYLADASHWVNDPIFQTPELSAAQRKKLNRWANNKVKWHTLKVKKKFHQVDIAAKFQKIGFPELLSRHLANLYFNQVFQWLLNGSGLKSKLRRSFSRREVRQ